MRNLHPLGRAIKPERPAKHTGNPTGIAKQSAGVGSSVANRGTSLIEGPMCHRTGRRGERIAPADPTGNKKQTHVQKDLETTP